MSRWIISDTHLGHKGIEHFRKRARPENIGAKWDVVTNPLIPMSSGEQHEAVYESLAQIPKRATLFLLGDIAFTKVWLDRIKKLPCKNKILFAGNHCLPRKDISMKDLVDTYEQVYALHKYKGYWMQHSPIHQQELRGKRDIHGHTHYQLMLDENGQPDPRYINVCCEYTGHKPITWEYAISDQYWEACTLKWEQYKQQGLTSDKGRDK